MKIYFAGSIRGGRVDVGLYPASHFQVYTKFGIEPLIYP